jgi:hypothetical protein
MRPSVLLAHPRFPLRRPGPAPGRLQHERCWNPAMPRSPMAIDRGFTVIDALGGPRSEQRTC